MSENEIHIDVDRVSRELKIRPDIYLRIVSSFAETLGQKMTDLSQALESRDYERMRKILHEIKGTSGNLRLQTIFGPQETLHLAVKAQESYDKLQQYTDILKSETAKLQVYVKELVNKA